MKYSKDNLKAKIVFFIKNYWLLSTRAVDKPIARFADFFRLVIIPSFAFLILSAVLGITVGAIINSYSSIIRFAGIVYSEEGQNETDFISGKEYTIGETGVLQIKDKRFNLIISLPADFQISEEAVFINSEYVILDSKSDFTFRFSDRTLKINKGALVFYLQKDSEFHVLSGKLQISTDAGIEPGKYLAFNDLEESSKNTDRAVFQSISKEFYDLLVAEKLLPLELSDLKPPIIELVSPSGNSIDQQTITVSIKTEPEAIVLINGSNATANDEGLFTKEMQLKEGDNEIKIEAKDTWGNKAELIRSITYTKPVVTPQPSANTGDIDAEPRTPQAPTCNQSDFNAKLLCLINNHRSANGKKALSSDSKLNLTAQSHSQWMNSTGNLSHTGENGSTPFERCQLNGTSCNAENIAYNSAITSDKIFQQWKNSPGHNQNMLGNFSFIGIGRSGGYATTVFR